MTTAAEQARFVEFLFDRARKISEADPNDDAMDILQDGMEAADELMLMVPRLEASILLAQAWKEIHAQ